MGVAARVPPGEYSPPMTVFVSRVGVHYGAVLTCEISLHAMGSLIATRLVLLGSFGLYNWGAATANPPVIVLLHHSVTA